MRLIALYGGVWGAILGYYVVSAYESNGGFSLREGVVTGVIFIVLIAVSYLIRKILQARARRT